MLGLALVSLVGCSGNTPDPVEIQRGPQSGRLEEPTPWGADLRKGQRLFLAAFSEQADLELVVTTPNGQTHRSASSRAGMEPAALHVQATKPGAHRVRVEGEKGPYTLLRPQPLSGTLCEQLAALTTKDPWKLPGVEHPGASEARRNRLLSSVMSWADVCSVQRLGGMDVGVSCARSGLDRDGANALFERIEAGFLDCHGKWTLQDASEGTSREWVAEQGNGLRFLRVREQPERGWQVSTGAMPLETEPHHFRR